ncbi:MAG TPA: hydrogenase maturation protease [Bacteroidales bacterium]|nr:hydrogenase maturation protease [Bacteroidales bacterium]
MLKELTDLISQKDKRILFVGIGNLLKMDDGAGVYISSNIKQTDTISALTVEVSIENYIGKINSLNPDILILIDAIDLKATPGTSKLLSINKIRDLTFNTHNISLNKVSDFFAMPVFVLGIQPEKIAFGENISYLVKNEADKIINLINFKNTQEVHHGC